VSEFLREFRIVAGVVGKGRRTFMVFLIEKFRAIPVPVFFWLGKANALQARAMKELVFRVEPKVLQLRVGFRGVVFGAEGNGFVGSSQLVLLLQVHCLKLQPAPSPMPAFNLCPRQLEKRMLGPFRQVSRTGLGPRRYRRGKSTGPITSIVSLLKPSTTRHDVVPHDSNRRFCRTSLLR
jgi:hypothetical protein